MAVCLASMYEAMGSIVCTKTNKQTKIRDRITVKPWLYPSNQTVNSTVCPLIYVTKSDLSS